MILVPFGISVASRGSTPILVFNIVCCSQAYFVCLRLSLWFTGSGDLAQNDLIGSYFFSDIPWIARVSAPGIVGGSYVKDDKQRKVQKNCTKKENLQTSFIKLHL